MDAAHHQKDAPQRIIFFDGLCNLCNGFINFIVARDQKGKNQIASLQGHTAKDLLVHSTDKDLNSIVFYHKSKGEIQIYTESSAAIRVIASLSGAWKIALIFFLMMPLMQ